MAKTWVLDTDTKGTGAQVLPLEKVLEKPAQEEPASRPRRRAAPSARQSAAPPPRSRREKPSQASSGPLPAGHVRKKATGEIGRVEAVDAKAGTARVRWLKQGRSSTVPLAAVSRR